MHTRTVGRWMIVLTSVYVCLSILFAAPLQSANDRSRWATVYSLVHLDTFHIDKIDSDPAWYTIDKVRHQHPHDANAHFYSSKPPLLSTMVAGLYWIQRHTLGLSIRQHPALVIRSLLLLINAVPFVWGLVSFRRSLLQLQLSDSAIRFLLAVAGLGTMVNPFLTTLNNHTPATACVMICLAAIIRIADQNRKSTKDFTIVGLTAALTTCFELPAALFGLMSFFLVLSFDKRKTLCVYVPAAIVPLIAFFVTNWICTGGIKPFYAYYGTEKYEYIHEGIPSYWMNPQGLDANAESPPIYALHCLFGHHGVFSLTPVFLLSLVGWPLSFRRGHSVGLRLIGFMGAFLFASILTFYLTRTQNYNYGGNTTALRWMLWLSPFLLYATIPILKNWGEMSRLRTGCTLLLMMSVASSCYSLQQPWKPNWLYRLMESANIIDYRPPTPEFSMNRYSLISVLPQKPTIGSWVRSGTDHRLILSTPGVESVTQADGKFLSLSMTLQKSGRQIQTDLLIDMAGFRSGLPMQDWLMAENQPVPKWAENLLRGLPASRRYRPDSNKYVRYRREDGQHWAVKTIKGAARVQVQHTEFGKCWQRCDVWNASEAAFGIVAWRVTLSSDETVSVLERSIWRSEQFPPLP